MCISAAGCITWSHGIVLSVQKAFKGYGMFVVYESSMLFTPKLDPSPDLSFFKVYFTLLALYNQAQYRRVVVRFLIGGGSRNEEPLVDARVDRRRSLVLARRDVELIRVGAVLRVRDCDVDAEVR